MRTAEAGDDPAGSAHCSFTPCSVVECVKWVPVSSTATAARGTPRTIYLARTVEYTESHNCIPGIEGRVVLLGD
jgi:hypothetical protein